MQFTATCARCTNKVAGPIDVEGWNESWTHHLKSKECVLVPPKVGEVWRENDRRFIRRVRVLEVKEDRVKIQTLQNEKRTNGIKIKTGAVTWASIKRFNCRSGGYSRTEWRDK